MNESSSGGKPYIGGSIRQNECPPGTKTNNIQVQLLLTSGPFLASRHQDNSILHIFFDITSLHPFFFFSTTESPSEQVDEQCLKKESTESKGSNRNNGLNRREEQHSLLTQSHSKIRKTEISTQYYRNRWTTWTALSHPKRCFFFFFFLTERDFVVLTFLTECNSTALTPRFLPNGSATIPVSRHTTSIPLLALHYGHT